MLTDGETLANDGCFSREGRVQREREIEERLEEKGPNYHIFNNSSSKIFSNNTVITVSIVISNRGIKFKYPRQKLVL